MNRNPKKTSVNFCVICGSLPVPSRVQRTTRRCDRLSRCVETTAVIFLDDLRRASLARNVPHGAENQCGPAQNLTPREGHLTRSPWQRRGTTIPPKKSALQGHPNLLGPFQRGRQPGAPLQGLRFYNGSNPWRCHGLRVACPFGT